MTIQTVNLGTAPTGAGGDTFRSTGAKMNENFTDPSHAASRYVGMDKTFVMEVGAFGVGATTIYDLRTENLTHPNQVLGRGLRAGIIEGSKVGVFHHFVQLFYYRHGMMQLRVEPSLLSYFLMMGI